jgi:hypothetical protein
VYTTITTGLKKMGKRRTHHPIEYLADIYIPCEKAEQDAGRLQTFGPRLTPSMAQELQGNADRQGNQLMWIVAEEYRHFYAVVVTEDGIGSGWFSADSLTELRQYLPLGLVRSDVQPSETPGVIEIWVPA